jgi:polysaccharide chain length determinant protein (PEP-CTERM system associated)
MASLFELADLPRPVIRYGVGLWRRRWAAMGAIWAVALAGWFALWLIPDKYQSGAQVYVQTETILDPVMNGVTARPNYERRVEVMRLQLLTRPNVEEVIVRAGLDKEITAKDPRARAAETERLIDWVTGQINIESPQEMYFVITYRHSDPVIARNVVDALLNLLIEQDLGASLSENEEARRRLDGEIKAFDDRLTAKEREVAAFRRLHGGELALYDGNNRQREMIEQDLSRVGDELAQAERHVATLRALLSTTQSTTSGTELDRLMVELAALRSQYEENYPDIQAVQARIDQLQSSGQGELPTNPEYKRISAELRVARDQAAGLADRQKRLRADLETLSFAIGQAPGVVADLQRIERDYEQTRKSYEELIQRRDRLALTENLGAGGQGVEYKVFERPAISLIPTGMPRLMLVIAVLVAAIGAGVGFAFLLTWMQKSFSQESELTAAFGLPVLGALSEVKSDAVLAERRRDYKRLAGAFAALAAVAAFYVYWEVMRLPTINDGGATSASLDQLLADAAAAQPTDVSKWD